VAGCPNWLDSYVKQVCFGHGVPVIFLGAYRTFALQVQKAKKHAKGDDLAIVTRALVERYTEKGLRREVLASLAFDVFNIKVAN
jgi:hypothetical protein